MKNKLNNFSVEKNNRFFKVIFPLSCLKINFLNIAILQRIFRKIVNEIVFEVFITYLAR
jgi:hypothetical protein